MKILEAGHIYELDYLDGDGVLCENTLTFVMRNDPPEKYPGNKSAHAGCIMQEVLRACIDRAKHVNKQFASYETEQAISYMRRALLQLEVRATRLHGESPIFLYEMKEIENAPACARCGHIHAIEHDEEWHIKKQKQLPPKW